MVSLQALKLKNLFKLEKLNSNQSFFYSLQQIKVIKKYFEILFQYV